MTTTEVLNRFAQAFGQDPMLQPHGRYQCGHCDGSFGLGDISIVLWPGGGRFQCAQCSRGGGVNESQQLGFNLPGGITV